LSGPRPPPFLPRRSVVPRGIDTSWAPPSPSPVARPTPPGFLPRASVRPRPLDVAPPPLGPRRLNGSARARGELTSAKIVARGIGAFI